MVIGPRDVTLLPEDFATPNADNSRRLLQGAGFDPRPTWTWNAAGGRGKGRVIWVPHTVEERLNQWLRVRHAIAHGHESLPPVEALLAVRQAPGHLADPSLRLVDAIQCIAFIRKLARVTSDGLATHLQTTAPSW